MQSADQLPGGRRPDRSPGRLGGLVFLAVILFRWKMLSISPIWALLASGVLSWALFL